MHRLKEGIHLELSVGLQGTPLLKSFVVNTMVLLWICGLLVLLLIFCLVYHDLSCRLCGYPPFPQTNDSIAMRMIVSGTYEFHEKEWKDISDEAKEFIRALLVPNPQRRATARMVELIELYHK